MHSDMRSDELAYLTRRAELERSLADASPPGTVRDAHAQLASLYQQRVDTLPNDD